MSAISNWFAHKSVAVKGTVRGKDENGLKTVAVVPGRPASMSKADFYAAAGVGMAVSQKTADEDNPDDKDTGRVRIGKGEAGTEQLARDVLAQLMNYVPPTVPTVATDADAAEKAHMAKLSDELDAEAEVSDAAPAGKPKRKVKV